MAKRRKFSEREVVSIVARQVDFEVGEKPSQVKGILRCPVCGWPILESALPYIERDHIQALELGGEDTPENCQFVHSWCHRDKTKNDIRRIAKAKRQAGETGQRARRERRDSSSIQGRPMDGTKASGLRKRMDGSVERREDPAG